MNLADQIIIAIKILKHKSNYESILCQKLADKYLEFRSGVLFPVPKVIQLHPSPRNESSDPRRPGNWNRSSLGQRYPGTPILTQAHISGALTLKNSRHLCWHPIPWETAMLTQNTYDGQICLCCVYYKKDCQRIP